MFILGPVSGLKFRMFFLPQVVSFIPLKSLPLGQNSTCVFSGNDSRKYFIGAGIWVSTSSL